MNYRINIYFYLCLILLMLNAGCTQEVPVATTKPMVTTPQTQTPNPIPPPQNKPIIGGSLGQQKEIVAKSVAAIYVECTTINKTLPENILTLSSPNVTAFISANATTKDVELGESHRVFEVKSGPNCEVIFSKNLPINVSADFPYYLSKDACNEKLGLIGIRGFQSANVFELATKKLFPDLKPKFLTNREAADATSGMISHLFFDQNFLYGYAVDFGVFAFDIKQNGSPLLPIFELSETQLFGFSRGKGEVDVIIPMVTFTEDGTLDLKMKNVFKRPVNITPALNFKINKEKYILFKEKVGTSPVNHLVVDMIKKEQLVLPKEIAESSIEKVIEFLK